MNSIRPGDIFKTNEGGSCVVIEYNGCYDVLVEHIDDHKHRATVTSNQLRGGRIKNPFRPKVFGVGFIGSGPHKGSINGKDTHAYTAWNGMLERCYSEKFQKKHPAYIGCTVSPDWHNFQTFSDWYENQRYKGVGYHLDKDILKKGNKVYCPDFCRFVPSNINKLLQSSKKSRGDLPIGVTFYAGKFCAHSSKSGKKTYIGRYDTAIDAFMAYKKARESNIAECAELYKEFMDSEVYEALINYEIELTD